MVIDIGVILAIFSLFGNTPVLIIRLITKVSDFRITFLIDFIIIVDMPSNPQLFLFGILFIICITFVSLTFSNISDTLFGSLRNVLYVLSPV